MAVALRSSFTDEIDAEIQKNQLTPRERATVANYRYTDVQKTEFVQSWYGATEALFDKIVGRIQRKYNLDEMTADSLLDGKECKGTSITMRTYSFTPDNGRTIFYGVFACCRDNCNNYNIAIATYRESFHVYDCTGKNYINQTALIKHFQLIALQNFSTEFRRQSMFIGN